MRHARARAPSACSQNRAEPVLLVDLPDESGGATADDNALLTSAAEALKKRYPEMFKPSQNCRAPHVNVDVLRNEMLKAEVRSEGCMHMRRRLHA